MEVQLKNNKTNIKVQVLIYSKAKSWVIKKVIRRQEI